MNNLYILYKKLNRKNGFSLTEVLTTMIIMSFVGIMVTSGILSSARVYKQITESSNAQLMLSNTITALQDEIIYAKPGSITVNEDNDTISFEHVTNENVNNENVSKYIETIKFFNPEDNSSGDKKGICISYGKDSVDFHPLISYQNATSLYNKWEILNIEDDAIEIAVYACKSDEIILSRVNEFKILLLNG